MTENTTSGVEEKATSEGQGLVYEFSYHLIPTLGEEEVEKEVAGFKALIEKGNGTIVSEEEPQSMNLAYTMEKKQEGKNAKFNTSLFGVIKFEGDAETLDTLQEEVDISKTMLRYLIIKTLREYQPLQSKPVFREVTPEEAKPIAKPKMEEAPKEDAKPLTEEELDKSIEDLVKE